LTFSASPTCSSLSCYIPAFDADTGNKEKSKIASVTPTVMYHSTRFIYRNIVCIAALKSIHMLKNEHYKQNAEVKILNVAVFCHFGQGNEQK